MKITCTSFAVVATCLAFGCFSNAEVPVGGEQETAPYPASGWKPSGRLLLLPVRQQEHPSNNEYGPPEQISATEQPTVTPKTEESGNASSFPASQQLQQQPGVNSGVYHVLLPDGRLQRVEFTTAPLKSDAAQSFTSPSQYQQQQAANGYNSFSGQYQQEYQPAVNGDNSFNGQYQQQPQKYQQAVNGDNSFNGQYQQQPQKYQQAVNGDNSFNGQYQQQPQEQVVSYEIQKSQNYELAPVQQFAFPGAFPNAFPSEGQSAKFTQGQAVGQSGYQKPSFQQNQFGLNTFEQKQTQQNQFGQSSFQQGGKYQVSQPSGFSQSNGKFQQERQYLSPRSNSQSQYKVSQGNVAASNSGKYTGAQQQQAQPQVFGYQQVYFTQQSEQTDAESVQSPAEGAGYVANVQYKDVEPIPGPIYSYNPAPLVRILRKTE